MDSAYLDFPFGFASDGSVAQVDEDHHLRERLMQILFTSPGERVMLPDFGCGARDLIFAGNNPVLAAATEFKVARALQTYMGDQVLINGVDVTNDEEKLMITIEYTKTRDAQQRQAVFEFLPSEVLGGA
ncbi:MAG TPA: GPW/gp25 family protein [Candidatus Angelobacter sp.]|jgi:phage baseplate assembly protein W|nr:GPW/gp25 family protein [Candidatus Angelobacter sp.]